MRPADRKLFAFLKAGDSDGVLWYPNVDILLTDVSLHLNRDRILMAPTLLVFQACSDGPNISSDDEVPLRPALWLLQLCKNPYSSHTRTWWRAPTIVSRRVLATGNNM